MTSTGRCFHTSAACRRGPWAHLNHGCGSPLCADGFHACQARSITCAYGSPASSQCRCTSAGSTEAMRQVRRYRQISTAGSSVSSSRVTHAESTIARSRLVVARVGCVCRACRRVCRACRPSPARERPPIAFLVAPLAQCGCPWWRSGMCGWSCISASRSCRRARGDARDDRNGARAMDARSKDASDMS